MRKIEVIILHHSVNAIPTLAVVGSFKISLLQCLSMNVNSVWEKNIWKVNDMIIGRSIIPNLNGNYFWLWLKPDIRQYIDKRVIQVVSRLEFKSYYLKQTEIFWIDKIVILIFKFQIAFNVTRNYISAYKGINHNFI